MAYTPPKTNILIPKLAMFERRYIFQTIILGIHINLKLWGCMCFSGLGNSWSTCEFCALLVDDVTQWDTIQWDMRIYIYGQPYIYIHCISSLYSKHIVNMYSVSGFVFSKQAVVGNVFWGIFLGGWMAQQTNRWIMLKPFGFLSSWNVGTPTHGKLRYPPPKATLLWPVL